MKGKFVHLHLHSEYSLFSRLGLFPGICRIPDIAAAAKEFAMPAVALTDTLTMAGAYRFYRTMRDSGIRPIIGCEILFQGGGTFYEWNESALNDYGFPLVLLAENNAGYGNLCRLFQRSQDKLRQGSAMDHSELRDFSDGIIVLTGGWRSELCYKLSNPNLSSSDSGPKIRDAKTRKSSIAEAGAEISSLQGALGKRNLYLELSNTSLPGAREINDIILELADEFKVPVVAANDVYHVRKKDYVAHCVNTLFRDGNKYNDPGTRTLPTDDLYFKSTEEMSEMFASVPAALENTLEIAERCKVELPPEGKGRKLFRFDLQVPKKEWIRDKCIAGLAEFYALVDIDADFAETVRGIVIEQVDHELEVFEKMDMLDELLFMLDMNDYAKSRGFIRHPGGWGISSMVAYLLRITDIDPFKYSLVFESKFNPDTGSSEKCFFMTSEERYNAELVEHMRTRYGADKLAEVSVYGKYKTRELMLDIAKALDLDIYYSAIEDYFPDIGHPNEDLDSICARFPGIGNFLKTEYRGVMIRDIADSIIGKIATESTHIATMAFSGSILSSIVPLRYEHDTNPVIQYTPSECEGFGLLLMDILWKPDLWDYSKLLKISGKDLDPSFSIDKIPLDDRRAYELLSSDTKGRFKKFRSQYCEELCMKIHPENFEELTAVFAFSYPGHKDKELDAYIAWKKCPEDIEYAHDELRMILGMTYGVLLYRDQFIQIVHTLADITLAEADIIRRAIGKKKVEEVKMQHDKFLQGCMDNGGIPEKEAEAVWKKLESSAIHCSPKSHAAGHALLAYRMAYLEASYLGDTKHNKGDRL